MTADPMSVNPKCKSPLVNIRFVLKRQPAIPLVPKPCDARTLTLVAERLPLPLCVRDEVVFSQLGHFVLQGVVGRV